MRPMANRRKRSSAREPSKWAHESSTSLGREAAIAALGGMALAVVMTWPLAPHLGSDIGKNLGDPLLHAWQVAWIGHALLEQPLDLWRQQSGFRALG